MRSKIERDYKISRDDRDDIITTVNDNFRLLHEIESDILKDYVVDLDNIINRVKKIVERNKRDETEITNQELSELILEIPTILYYTGVGAEKLGMKETIMIAIKNELYNKTSLDAQGSVDAKKAVADLATQKEQLMQTIYKSAHKTIKFKIEVAFELLNSVKKILSDRMISQEKGRGYR